MQTRYGDAFPKEKQKEPLATGRGAAASEKKEPLATDEVATSTHVFIRFFS